MFRIFFFEKVHEFATYMGLEVGNVESYVALYMCLVLVLLFVGIGVALVLSKTG